MNTLKKIFFETKMTWKRVILLSVLCGVIPGLLMIPAALEHTSFQQPGISFEFWILFALYIILNCEKPVEAGLKTFVAFLISQPLIYLVQVPFARLGWQLFDYYPRWLLLSFLTLPGGMIAWYTKKGTILSALILSVANGILCFMLPDFYRSLLIYFPGFLLSVLFTLAEIVVFTLLLLPGKRERLVAFLLAAAMLIFFFVWSFLPSNALSYSYMEVEGEAPLEIVSENPLFDVSVEGNQIKLGYRSTDLRSPGTDVIRYLDKNGTEYEINLSYDNGYCSADY